MAFMNKQTEADDLVILFFFSFPSQFAFLRI